MEEEAILRKFKGRGYNYDESEDDDNLNEMGIDACFDINNIHSEED